LPLSVKYSDSPLSTYILNSPLSSVGDWTFNVWKANVKTPIFSAPLASSYLTCGRWSPTRPGVIFIARTDGCVDVWDLSDQSHKATMSHPSLAACAITSMEFWHHNNGRQQLVAVADVSGNLHILEIPRNLWRSHNNEETIMENFFQREVRTQYLYTICTTSVQHPHNVRTISVHYLYNSRTTSTSAQYPYNICAISAQYLYNICTLFAQYLYNICTISAQYLHNICTGFSSAY
jgi:WD40 repeat protein